MPDIDYTAWRFWFDVGQSVGTIAIAIYVYFMTRRKAVDQRFVKIESSITRALKEHRDDLDERCSQRKTRIETIEREARATVLKLENVPSHKDLAKLSERINDLNGSMSELNGRLGGINRAVDLINEFLINQGGKGAHS